MLTDIPTKASVQECLAAIDDDEQMTAKEVERLTALSKEQDLQWVLPTIDALEKKLRSLAKQKGHMQNQLDLMLEREAAANEADTHFATNVYDEDGMQEEGALVEQYGQEVRTTFVMRADLLRLRITNDVDETLYDSFEKGRADSLHTYTAVEGTTTKLTFFNGRPDKVRSYTRELLDYQWTFTVCHQDECDVLLRRVTLYPDKAVAPLLDTPSTFRPKVAVVEIVKVSEPQRLLKSYITKKARVWAADPCASKDDDPLEVGAGEELFKYVMDEHGLCIDADTGANPAEDPKGAQRKRAAAQDCYEDLLCAERQSLKMVLGLERFFHQFLTLHRANVGAKEGKYGIGKYSDSLPERVAGLACHITTLYDTMDAADVQSARALAERDATIQQLRKELAAATFDPDAK